MPSQPGEETREAPPRTRSSAFQVVDALKWPVALVALALIGYLSVDRAGDAAERSVQAPAETVAAAAKAVEDVAARFKTGTITTTFTAALPRLVPDGGPTLELAVLEATEVLRRTDERRVLFELVPLGATVSEIRIPTVYRYHVRLADPWRIDTMDRACVVHAPEIRPTLPPAIRTDRMERMSNRGWLRLDAQDQMDALESEITPYVSERAAARDTIDLVRDRSRRRIAELVRTWLLREDQWRDDRFTSVTVIFPDEEIAPSLRLEGDASSPRP
jgi:hypothetical protein